MLSRYSHNDQKQSLLQAEADARSQELLNVVARAESAQALLKNAESALQAEGDHLRSSEVLHFHWSPEIIHRMNWRFFWHDMQLIRLRSSEAQ